MRNYLIVGASSGIGLVVTKKLAAGENNVFALCRTGDALTNISGVTFAACDVTDNNTALPNIDTPIDGMAYLPGSITLKPFKMLRREDYLRDFEVNFLGATRAVQHYLPNLKDAENAAIVLMSTVAVQTGMAYHASIAGAKGAIEGLTRSLAAELAPSIRVNAVAPSLTETPLASHLINTTAKLATARKRHPLDRIGSPDDIANSVGFLLSEQAAWITGQVLAVDGGMSSLRML